MNTTHVELAFANPFLVCRTCRQPVPAWHQPAACGPGCDEPARHIPCGHLGAISTCPTWGPVDGCPVRAGPRARPARHPGRRVVTAPDRYAGSPAGYAIVGATCAAILTFAFACEAPEDRVPDPAPGPTVTAPEGDAGGASGGWTE